MTIQPHLETEICLTGPLEVAQLKKWASLQGIEPRRQQLQAVYFDTDRLDLARCKAGLRIRRESGQWVQTLKTEASGGSRQEWNFRHARLPASQLPAISPLGLPNDRDATRGLSKPLVVALENPEALKPKFVVQVRRTIWVFHQGPSTIELALDLGFIQAADQSQVSVQELELELQAGQPVDLWRAAADLLGHLGPGYQFEPRSKAQRGYGLLSPKFLEPQKSRTTLVKGAKPSLVFAEHLRAAAADLTQWLLRIQQADDPEGVHQSRVCLRRIRTGLKLLRLVKDSDQLAHLNQAAGQLASRLGRLRNLDVSLERFWLPLDQALASDPHIGRATAPLLAAQAAERAALRLDLLMPEVGQLICQLHILLESLDLPDQITRPLPVTVTETETVGLLEPAVLHPSETLGEFLLNRLKRRIKKLTARSKSDPEALHRLRLAYKAMRYAAPILDDLGVKARLDTISKKAARAQERLGDDQDRAVALQTLQQAMQSQSIEGETAHYCLAVLRGYLAAKAMAQS